MENINQRGNAPRSISLKQFREQVKALGYIIIVTTTPSGKTVDYLDSNRVCLMHWNTDDFIPLLEYLTTNKEQLTGLAKAHGINVYSLVRSYPLATKSAE